MSKGVERIEVRILREEATGSLPALSGEDPGPEVSILDFKVPLWGTLGELAEKLGALCGVPSVIVIHDSDEGIDEKAAPESDSWPAPGRDLSLLTMEEAGITSGTTLYFETASGKLSWETPLPEGDGRERYPVAFRTTRIRRKAETEPILLELPPAESLKEPGVSHLSRYLSSGLLLAMAGVMALSGEQMLLYAAVSAGMGLVSALIETAESRRKGKQEGRLRRENYERYIREKEREIISYRRMEADWLDEAYPGPKELAERIRRFSPALFDRREADDDFMDLRLGEGPLLSARPVTLKEKEAPDLSDELYLMARRLTERYQYLKKVPVVMRLAAVGGLGVCGEGQERENFMRALLLDLAARQDPSELKIFLFATANAAAHTPACFGEADAAKAGHPLFPFRRLPHVREGEALRAAFSQEENRRLLEQAYSLLSADSKDRKAYYLFLFWGSEAFQSHPISRFLEEAASKKAVFLFLEEKQEQLPGGLSAVIRLKGEGTAIWEDAAGRKEDQPFTFEKLSSESAAKLCGLLSPVEEMTITLEKRLPPSLTLFEMLGIQKAEQAGIFDREQEKGLRVPIGMGPKGLRFLDLHEEGDGPHGLVAGTTGSGKSELLLTILLSLSLHYSPERVNFTLIDFKGGGLTGQLLGLPQLSGHVTNMDGEGLSRFLLSLRAEILCREKLFAESGVSNLDAYRDKVGPMPHLILVVDEFAELKSKRPDFMEELISAARVGRSLGIHLILATQKPAGQVSEQIWSNSRFKICLKVQSPSDSQEVLRSPIASEIRETGRGVLKVGNHETFELFQSAYAGAPCPSEKRKPWQLLPEGAESLLAAAESGTNSNEEVPSQAQALIQRIAESCRERGIQPAAPICLPELTAELPYPKQEPSGEGILMGRFDEPEVRLQGDFYLPQSLPSALICGAAGQGKTTLFMTLILSAAGRYAPDELSFYVLDFGGSRLKEMASFPNVAFCEGGSEEQTRRLLVWLLSKLEERRQDGMEGKDRKVLMIDHFQGFREISQEKLLLPSGQEIVMEEALSKLLREGPGLGISVWLTAGALTGIGSRLLSLIPLRMAFHLNEEGDYYTLFGGGRKKPEPVPGRCLVQYERKLTKVQVYLPPLDTEELREAAKRAGACFKGHEAEKYLTLPKDISWKELFDRNQKAGAVAKGLPLGLDEDTGEVIFCDVRRTGLLAVCGEEKRAYAYLKGLLNTFRKSGKGLRVCLLDTPAGLFSELPKEAGFAASGRGTVRSAKVSAAPDGSGQGRVQEFLYTTDEAQALGFLKEMEEALEKREKDKNLRKSHGQAENQSETLWIFLPANPWIVKAWNGRHEAWLRLERILTRLRGLGGMILWPAENRPMPYGPDGLPGALRGDRHILFFGAASAIRITDAGSLRRYASLSVQSVSVYYLSPQGEKRLLPPTL